MILFFIRDGLFVNI